MTVCVHVLCIVTTIVQHIQGTTIGIYSTVVTGKIAGYNNNIVICYPIHVCVRLDQVFDYTLSYIEL